MLAGSRHIYFIPSRLSKTEYWSSRVSSLLLFEFSETVYAPVQRMHDVATKAPRAINEEMLSSLSLK